MSVTAPANLDFAIVVPLEEPLADVIVEQLAAARPGRELTRYSSLAEAASAHGDGQFLLVLADPLEALARNLKETGASEAALTRWKSAVAPVLSAARRLRRRICLVDARAVASGDPTTLALFAPEREAVGAGAIPALPDALYMVLAEALLARDAEASRFAAEITAMRRGATGRTVDRQLCDDALGDYADLEVERQLLRENIGLHIDQSGLLISKIKEGADQSQLGYAQAELDRMGGQLSTATVGPEISTQSALAAELARYKEMAADRNLQKAKAEALQRRLDDTQAKAAAREAALATVLLADQAADQDGKDRKRAEALEQELRSIYASRSWKITRPLRALRSVSKT